MKVYKVFIRDMKESFLTLEKAEEEQKEFKSKIK